MKKLFVLLMAVLLAVSACSSGGGAAPQPAGDGAASAGPQAPPADSEEVVKLNVATNLASTHLAGPYYQAVVDDINAAGGDGFDAKMFFSEQLGNEREIIDLIAQDVNDILCVSSLPELARRYPECMIFDAPYTFSGKDHLLNFSNGLAAQPLWDGLAEATNIRCIGTYYYGTRQVTANIPARTPEDFSGFKLRVLDSPVCIAMGKALGASPTPMQFGELYMALQQGVIDGQENPITTIMSANFYEVQNYLIMTSHSMPPLAFVLSESKWQSLTDQQRQIIQDAVDTCIAELSQAVADGEVTQLAELEALGMTIVEPDLDAFKTASLPMLEEFSSEWGDWYEVIQTVAG